MRNRSDAWRRTLVSPDVTIRSVIRALDQGAMQIVLVVTPDDVLQGTITDGDVRRGLLRGLSLDSPIDTIVQAQAIVVPPNISRETVVRMMHANRLRHVPVVDQQRRVVGLHLLDDHVPLEAKDNTVIIMAGGTGSRLRPHTERCPKPLLPVAGKPMLEHIMERAASNGFRNFVLAVNYLGHMIEDHFGDGGRWNVRIDYIHERSPLGTAGALGLLVTRPKQPILVTNGDVLTDLRYGELLDFHLHHGAAATMAVRRHEWQHPFGVVRIDGIDIVGFEEKPVSRSYVNAGVYVLEPDMLDLIESGESCDMPELFERIRSAGRRTVVYPMHEPWLDVGRPDDYAAAQDVNGQSKR